MADPNNNRVLIWNAVPTANGSAANVVLGQPSMTTAVANNGGVSARSLSLPGFVYANGGKLFVADSNNHRVSDLERDPDRESGARGHRARPAGHGDREHRESRPARARSGPPRGIHVDESGRLYVIDAGNNRIVYWSAVPTQNQAAADGVIGQPDLNSGLANNGGLTRTGCRARRACSQSVNASTSPIPATTGWSCCPAPAHTGSRAPLLTALAARAQKISHAVARRSRAPLIALVLTACGAQPMAPPPPPTSTPRRSRRPSSAGAPAAQSAAYEVLLAEWTGPYGGVPPWDKVDDQAVRARRRKSRRALARGSRRDRRKRRAAELRQHAGRARTRR